MQVSKWMPYISRKGILLLLTLFLAVLPALGYVARPAHAVSPLLFIGSQQTLSCASGGCVTALTVQSGDLLIAEEWFAGCSTLSDTTSSSPSETWTETQSFGGGFEIWTAIAHSSISYVVTFACNPGPTPAGDFSVANFRGTFNGFGSAVVDTAGGGGQTSGTDIATITVQAGSQIYEGVVVNSGTVCANAGGNSGQTNRFSNCNTSILNNNFRDQFYTTGPTVGAGTLALSMSWSGCSISQCQVRHSLLELTSIAPSGSGVGITTACYGNCGNPPITLINPNATHSVNFNQSLTLMYEFQAQANGFLVNATTNIARTYANGQRVSIGIYTVSSCPPNQIAFSQTCPGLLQSVTSTASNPSKGRFASTALQLPVVTGQWVGIAVSGLYSGLDLNETNAVCGTTGTGFCANPPGMVQVTGSIPTSITSTSTLSTAGISSTALWAWITTAIVNTGPGPGPGIPAVCPGLDCILTNLVNTSCTVVSASCLAGVSFFWALVLTIVSMCVFLYFAGQAAPNLNLRLLGVGEIGIMVFVGWLVMFAGLSLLPGFMVVLVFLIVSWLFLGRIKGTGPI